VSTTTPVSRSAWLLIAEMPAAPGFSLQRYPQKPQHTVHVRFEQNQGCSRSYGTMLSGLIPASATARPPPHNSKAHASSHSPALLTTTPPPQPYRWYTPG
jgi:hypothetical protein